MTANAVTSDRMPSGLWATSKRYGTSPAVPGKSTPTMRYVGGEGGTFSLSLVFDTTAAGTAVTAYTNKLLKLMDVDTSLPGYDAQRANGRPPWVKFHWGDLHSFKSVLSLVRVAMAHSTSPSFSISMS